MQLWQRTQSTLQENYLNISHFHCTWYVKETNRPKNTIFYTKTKTNCTHLTGKSTSANDSVSLQVLSLCKLLCFGRGELDAWDGGCSFAITASGAGDGAALTVTPGGNWHNKVSLTSRLLRPWVLADPSGSDNGGCRIWGCDGSTSVKQLQWNLNAQYFKLTLHLHIFQAITYTPDPYFCKYCITVNNLQCILFPFILPILYCLFKLYLLNKHKHSKV